MDVAIWQPSQIEADASHRAVVGPLQLWLRRAGDELHIAVERRSDPDGLSEMRPLTADSGVRPEDLNWARWVVGAMGDTVQLTPTTPNRPVVVRPEVPLRLPSKQEALFFVNFPIWVRVSAGTDPSVTLCEEPCVVLSKTWFGDPMLGALCYSMRTRARRDITDTQPRRHRAVCPLLIRNFASQQLELERFCVHVEHLTLFEGATRLWANQVNVTFRGDDKVGQLEYAKHPPTYESVGQAVCEARRPARESLLERSLGSLGLFADDGA
jgi:hypothetical protein